MLQGLGLALGKLEIWLPSIPEYLPTYFGAKIHINYGEGHTLDRQPLPGRTSSTRSQLCLAHSFQYAYSVNSIPPFNCFLSNLLSNDLKITLPPYPVHSASVSVS